MKNLNHIKNIIIILIASVFIATFLMSAIQLLPVDRMRDHVIESADTLVKEGLYPNWAGGDTYAVSDNFTDSIILRICTYNGDENIVKKAMLNTSWWVDNTDYINILITSLDDSIPKDKTNYARYWHGYEIILKPLLLFFNVQEIRIINMFMQLLFLCLSILLIVEKLSRRYIPIILITLLGINPITCMLSFQFSCIYYITLLTLIFILWKKDYVCDRSGYIYVFLVDGLLCAFFDFLTYPLVALAIPLMIFIIADNKNSFVRNVVIPPIMWMIGYGGLWVSKWVISYLLTGYNTIRDAFDQAKYRTSGEIYTPDGFNRLSGVKINFMVFSKSPQLIIFLLFVFIYLGLFIKRAIKQKRLIYTKATLAKLIPLAIVTIYPFVWYVVLLNHSYIHIFIAYRNVAIFAAGIISLLTVLV